VISGSNATAVPDADIWVVRKSGTNYYLENKATGQYLFGDSSASGPNVHVCNVAATGSSTPHGYRLLWNYDSTNHKLLAYNVASVAGETETGAPFGINGAAGGNYTIYIFKKTFHTHTFTSATFNWTSDYSSATATATCTSCGQSETVSAVISTNVTNPATCTGTGSATYTATATFSNGFTATDTKTGTLAALGHNMEQIPAVAATCTAGGNNAYYHCTRCGKYFTTSAGTTETTPAAQATGALGHSWGTPVFTWSGFTASATRTCTRDATHTETQNATVTSAITTQPTCTAPGVKTYTATVTFDGQNYTDTKTESIAATGHTWGAWTNDNDDYTNGTHTRTCANDASHTETEGHNWTLTSSDGADCVTAGTNYYRCSDCNATTSVTIQPTGHHTLTPHAANAATCGAAGNSAYWECTVCGKFFSDANGTTEITANSWVIPATGNHTWGAWVITTPATTSAPGERQHTCSVCGTVQTEVIPIIVQPTMTVGSTTTTRGSTVTLDVDLSDNPGIFAQSFVITFPKTLTLVSAQAVGDVYPTTEAEHYVDPNDSSIWYLDPVSNARMNGYFTAANLSMTGMYGLPWEVDNGALENSYNNGTILRLTFTVPANGTESYYDVGIFGTYAADGQDACDENLASISPAISYVGGRITVSNPVTCTHNWGELVVTTPAGCTTAGEGYRECTICHEIKYETIPAGNHDYVVTVVPATCETDGYTLHVCRNCNNTYTDNVVPATGHRWDNGTVIRQASGLSGSVTRYVCQNDNSHIRDEENNDATGTGISTSGDTNPQVYKYILTNTIRPGHEYVIANSNAAGTYKALYDNSGATGSGSVTIASESGKMVATPSSDAYVWNSYSGISFANKSTGNFLKAFNGTTTADTSLNLALTSDFSNTNDYKFSGSNNVYQSASGYYLGYEASITAAAGGSSSNYADADGHMQRIGNGYYWSDADSDHDTYKIFISGSYTLEFDACFSSASDQGYFGRGAGTDEYYIGPTSSRIKIGSNTYDSVPYTFDFAGTHSYGNHWQHFKIECNSSNKLNMWVDGVKVIDNKSISTPASTNGIISQERGTGTVYIDNLHISDSSHSYTYDFDNDDLYLFAGSSANNPVSVPSNPTNNATITTLATDVFVGDTSSKNIYFYEKTPVYEEADVYQKATTPVAGETYVLVDRNLEGSGNVLNASASTFPVTVYSDGISYTPYVTTTTAYEFVVTAKGTGYIFNNPVSGTFLSINGSTQTLSSDCYLPVTTDASGVKVSLAGSSYYLYKKTPITAIDTDLLDDFAVIDFGGGFTDITPYIRNNDDWAAQSGVGMTVEGIASAIPSGVSTNNVFYASNKVTYAAAPINITTGTVTYNDANGTISYAPFTGANAVEIASPDTFYYGCTVDNLGAHMYAAIEIIPATSIYYEDSCTGFITYTDGNYPDAQSGAHWTTVGTANPINYLFEDMYSSTNATYGYNSANNGTYLYSGGQAHMVTVSAANEDKSYADQDWMPKVSFTFHGTGCEIFTATGRSAGAIFISVERDGSTVGEYFTDNYFGYSWNGSEWTPGADSSDPNTVFYQVPVFNQDFGTYGEYTVTIMVNYNKWFDGSNLGYAEFYFDGFRVYNPLGTTSAVANAQYASDGEYNPKFINLHDKLTRDASATGSLFTDGSGLTRFADNITSDYYKVGANEEIMLDYGKAVSFKLSSENAIPSKAALGAKITQGATAGTVTVAVTGGETKTIAVSSGSDMYYDITSLLDGKWTQNGSNYETPTITITNASPSGIVSLTNLKFSSSSISINTPTVNFAAAGERDVWDALAEIYGVEIEIGDVNGDGKVNAKDVNLIKKFISGTADLTRYDLEAADMNGDGKINAIDINLIKKAISG
jgi:hypothetical protein